jgi:hypothetical protein
MDPATGNVQMDPQRAKQLGVYFALVAVVGATLIAFAAARGWGFPAFAGGAVLLLSGAGGFAGMKATGGVGHVTCPACHARTAVMQLRIHRYLACPGCGTWLEGALEMRPVQPGHIAPRPIFTARVPAEVRWPKAPDGSYLNPSGAARPCIELREIVGRRGPGVGLVAPVRVERVVKLDAPFCKDDPDGVWLSIDAEPTLAFRSYDYLRAFTALNRAAS